MTLAELRDNALSPCLYSDRVADGVLHDVGLAAWEMPATTSGGGYMHWIRPQFHNDQHALLIPTLRDQSSIVNRQRIADLNTALNTAPYGTLELADLATVYGRGTSLCLQNCTIGLTRSAAGVDSYYDSRPDIGSILMGWDGSKRLYIHCGLLNNEIFAVGSPRFNSHYALQCRLGNNPFRQFVMANDFGIAETHYVHQTNFICADGVGRPWLKPLVDTSHHVVVGLARAQIAELVAAYGTTAVYVVHGEASMRNFLPAAAGVDRSKCESHPLPNECQHCEPATAYSEHLSIGFRAYLEHVLGLSLSELNERWGSSFTDFDDVEPHLPGFFCPGRPQGVADYAGYLGWLMHEAGLQEGIAGKTANPAVRISSMRFGLLGLEQSWLAGDFGSVGDWSGETETAHVAERSHVLQTVSVAARLSGVPMSFPITAPTYRPVAQPVGQDDWPVLLRGYRQYAAHHLGWFWRDVLTAGSAHIGYLKAPTVGFGADAGSREEVLSSIENIALIHKPQLSAMGAWQRIAIDCDQIETIVRPHLDNGSGRVTSHLIRRFRDAHAPVAVFHDPRVRQRPISRWWLSQSIVIVPYHSDAETLRAEYEVLHPAGGPGATIIVGENVGDPPGWVTDDILLATAVGVLYRAMGGDNVWLFRCREAGPCQDDDFWGAVASTLERHVVPFVRDELVGGTAPNPVQVVAQRPEWQNYLASSFVADGLNWTVAVSLVVQPDTETPTTPVVTVSIRPEIESALGVTYTPQTVSLEFGETKLITLTAVGHGIDVAAAIANATPRAAALQTAGYDATPATQALTLAAALEGDGDISRALAAYVAAVRMPLLRVTPLTEPPRVQVEVRKIGLPEEAADLPVAGASVMLTWPLNAREEGATGTTDGSGVVTIETGLPLQQRWDFATAALVPPAAGAEDVVEVLVTDQETGASTRQTVSLA